MLICMKCRIEYEEGMDFCPQCGGPLVIKEKPVSGHEDTDEKEEVKPKERLICPNCKILYERMKTCVRCGAPLVKQTPSQEKEEPKPSDVPEEKKEAAKAPYPSEAKKETSQVPPPKKRQAEATRDEPKPFDESQVKKKKYQAAQTPDDKQEPSPIQPAEKNFGEILPEELEKRMGSTAKSKKVFLRSPLGVFGIIIIIAVAVYVLWSLYVTTEGPRPSVPSSEEATSLTPSNSTTHLPTTPKASSVEAKEIENIKGLLDKIRLANLLKDIDLFMSCYSDEFENREGRRRMALESWRDFDYNELSYNLKGHSISGNTAKARVEWLMRISPRTGGKFEESKTALDVIFKKEGGAWKVKEIIHLR